MNPLAAEEHAREKARLEELTSQRQDLERSLEELAKLRDDLTVTVERLFEETYSAVERHFAEVAGTLFPGGTGRLVRREAEAQEEEGGIEVELQPAGKRITRLSLLSGGEKALGAISFLFALFLARPCPFYLLDEVEAALDDTNIGRFVELRAGSGDLDEDGARAIVRELKAVGGDLRALRLALTGDERGPELWTVVAALPESEAVERARRAMAD